MKFKKITDLDLHGKTLFIRTDLNVPIENGQITDDTRILAALPTIQFALDHGANVIVATHLGRPKEGVCNQEDSIEPVAAKLSTLLNLPTLLIDNLEQPIDFSMAKLAILQNVRCNVGEKKNSDELAKKYANLCDVFVHDAFATAHRAEASTDAIAKYTKEVCAGLLMISELESLGKALLNPARPIVAIVGGSKVSTKLMVLENLANKVDYLIVGGGILNTFLAAAGFNVGKSLVEVDLIDKAREIISLMHEKGSEIPLPKDVVVATEFSDTAIATIKSVSNVADNEMILDVGPEFSQIVSQVIKRSQTIIWNGPLGVFEIEQFANGTLELTKAVAKSKAFSLAGGGDTIAAINKYELADEISYISTAGGALLEFLEGKRLPALEVLEKYSV